MRFLLAGYYGSGNLGDEAILGGLLSGIRALYPDAQITALSADPQNTFDCHKLEAVKKFSYFKILRALWRCDVFVLGGGGVLQDATSRRSLLYYSWLVWTAKLFKKKVILLGQGIGPVKHKFFLRHAIKNVDLITVRDEPSLKELVALKVHVNRAAVTSDLAFMTDVPDRDRANLLFDLEGIVNCKDKFAGVAVRPLVNDINAEAKYQAIASMCDWLSSEKNSQVVFLIFKTPDDIEITKKITSLMKYPAHILLRKCQQDEMVSVMSRFDYVIGMRLHSLIFAARAKVPAFGLSYDPKVESFQKMIDQPYIGSDRFDVESLEQEIGRFIDAPPVISHKIDQFIEKARMNVRYMKECIENKKICVLGVDIDNISLSEAAAMADKMIQKKNHNLIVTPNPEMIMCSLKDVELRTVINSASISVPDGVGMMLAGRLLGRKFRQRIPGIDLMQELIDLSRAKGYRIFLLGGKEGVAEKAAKKIGDSVVGHFHGYSKNDQLVIDAIKKAKPDILFVGLGSPRQEKWASRHMRDLDVPLVMCVGGSLDVLSGNVKRAPYLMRAAGIEWLYRLIREPYRWRRMTVLPKFLAQVIGSRF